MARVALLWDWKVFQLCVVVTELRPRWKSRIRLRRSDQYLEKQNTTAYDDSLFWIDRVNAYFESHTDLDRLSFPPNPVLHLEPTEPNNGKQLRDSKVLPHQKKVFGTSFILAPVEIISFSVCIITW